MSPTISRTAVLASASVVAASALVFGAVAAASAAPQPRAVAITSSTSSAPATETTKGSEVLADITVTIKRTDSEVNWTKVIYVTGVPVADGVELEYGAEGVNVDYEWDVCLGISVDVSLDPQKVEVYDDSPDCFPTQVNSVEVKVVLTGATFGTVTVGSDQLFAEPLIIDEPDFELRLDAAAHELTAEGNFRFGRSVVTGLSAPFPVLSSVSASGSTFTALWQGAQAAPIAGGTAAFNFAAAATGATPVLATPVFTG